MLSCGFLFWLRDAKASSNECDNDEPEQRSHKGGSGWGGVLEFVVLVQSLARKPHLPAGTTISSFIFLQPPSENNNNPVV